MEKLKKTRKIMLCGILGAGTGSLLGFGLNTLVDQSPAEVRAIIKDLKEEQTSLIDDKAALKKELGAACFDLIDGIYEGGMGLDQAVTNAITNTDPTVCGSTEDEVLTAVQKVSAIEVDLGAVAENLRGADTELQIANNGPAKIVAFGCLFAIGGAGLGVAGLREH